MYSLTWIALRRFLKKMKRPRSESTVYERLYGIGMRIIMIALPIAVILAWTGV